MADKTDIAQQILDTALALAEARSWEELRLYHIADTLGLGLEEVRRHYPAKEDLMEAWFDRADHAMLEDAARLDFLQLSMRARLHRLIMTWLDALAPHRRVTRQMILGALSPGRLPTQLWNARRVRRTVRWMYEAARLEAGYTLRMVQETALSSLYVATFFYWMTDDSQASANTRRFLDSLLANAEWLSSWTFLGGSWKGLEQPITPAGRTGVTRPPLIL